MALINLKKEMAGKDISIEEMAQFLQLHRNTVANKIDGSSKFTIDEAFKVHDKFFPEVGLAYLFKEADQPTQSAV